MQYMRHLSDDERELVDLFVIWCVEVERLAPTTAMLYRSLVAKVLVRELKYTELSLTERSAWHRFEEFVAWSMD